MVELKYVIPDFQVEGEVPVLEYPRMVVYDSRNICSNCAFVVWRGFLSLNKGDSKNASNALLAYIQENKVEVLISNHDFLQGSTEDYRHWIDAHFWKQAVDYGLRAEILLPCPDFIGSTTLNNMYEQSTLMELVATQRFIVLEAQDGPDALDLAKRITDQKMSKGTPLSG